MEMSYLHTVRIGRSHPLDVDNALPSEYFTIVKYSVDETCILNKMLQEVFLETRYSVLNLT